MRYFIDNDHSGLVVSEEEVENLALAERYTELIENKAGDWFTETFRLVWCNPYDIKLIDFSYTKEEFEDPLRLRQKFKCFLANHKLEASDIYPVSYRFKVPKWYFDQMTRDLEK